MRHENSFFPSESFSPIDPVSSSENISSVNGGNELQDVENENLFLICESILAKYNYEDIITNPESGENFVVIDLDKIKEALKTEHHSKGFRISREKLISHLFQKYRDTPVLIPQNVTAGEFKAQPLFYYPVSVTEATSSIAIADTNFHIAPWELVKSNSSRDRIYPTSETSSESIKEFEVKFAVTLFHPKYADGRRGPDGRLYLKNRNYDPKDLQSKKRLPLSRDSLDQYNLYRILQTVRSEGDIQSRTVRDGIADELPNLLASGEIKLDDFRELTLKDGDFNSEFSPKSVPKNGYVMLNGVNQYVGRRFEGCIVYPFTDERALIFREDEGRRVLVSVFTIVDKEGASDVYVGKDGRSVPRANADKTRLKEINYSLKISKGSNSMEQSFASQRQIELENDVTEAVAQLIETARKAEELVVNELKDSDPIVIIEAVKKVRDDLLTQAERAIEMASATKDANKLKENLHTFTYDARGYVSVLQSVGIERMLSNPIEKIPATKLSQVDKDRMQKLLNNNYKNETPEFQVLVAKSLADHMTDPKTDFYILRNQNGMIISYNRFDKEYDVETSELTRQYFGSFNADPIYFGVGSIMMEQTIKDQLEQCPAIYAHCDPYAKISQKYIEWGFIGTQTLNPAGKFSFEIWRSKDSSSKLKTKQMSEEELMSLAGETVPVDVDYFVREVEPNDQFLELDSGLAFLLTRYFSIGDKTYATFELNVELSQAFVLPVENNL